MVRGDARAPRCRGRPCGIRLGVFGGRRVGKGTADASSRDGAGCGSSVGRLSSGVLSGRLFSQRQHRSTHPSSPTSPPLARDLPEPQPPYPSPFPAASHLSSTRSSWQHTQEPSATTCGRCAHRPRCDGLRAATWPRLLYSGRHATAPCTWTATHGGPGPQALAPWRSPRSRSRTRSGAGAPRWHARRSTMSTRCVPALSPASSSRARDFWSRSWRLPR